MNKKLLLSFPAILLLVPMHTNAAVRVTSHTPRGNANYNTQQANITQTDIDLPVRVADKNLAERIARGNAPDGASIADLEKCSMIYPGGEFAWDTPTAGSQMAGSKAKCVSVVEMRIVNGTDDIVVARANVASGDYLKCNISSFPEHSYTRDATTVIFPSDKEPTIDDVTKVMNDEQKKNAGFKIVAGLVVGGLVGNAAGKNDLGQDNLIGTAKGKMQGTAIGALSGGALMAGNSYAGKVGGDVIMSAGVNAAAGGAIGNMMANGESVLRIEDCEDLRGIRTTCLWGIIEKHAPLPAGKKGFYNITTGKTIVCNNELNECVETRLIGLTFDRYTSESVGFDDQNFLKYRNNHDEQYAYNANTDTLTQIASGDIWISIKSGGTPTTRISAMIPDFKNKGAGVKMKDWYKWRITNQNIKPIGRNAKGLSHALEPINGEEISMADFYPLTIDASDGGLIDISNKARLGGTLTGAGTGAALGAFTGYQGATDEVETRWFSAVQEYKDSLQKVYCVTGTRFLSQYNDVVIIPNM